MTDRFKLARAAFLIALSIAAPAAAAPEDDYPNKPIRLVVPFPPGGGADVLGRIVADGLSERLGKSVIVDNRGGANGNIGMAAVAKSPADGYTLILATVGTWVVNPHLYPPTFDVVADFAPIMLVTSSPGILVVHPSLPVHNVQDLIALAKAQPGKLNYGSAGIGGFGHISGVMFSLMTGTQLIHVPYKGAGPAVADAIGGHIQLLFNDALATVPHVTSGSLRGIAVTSLTRMPMLPDMPTIDESGVKDFDNSSWAAMAAPAGTPKQIIAKLHGDMAAMLKSPVFQQKIGATGATIIAGTPDQFAAYLKIEIAKFGRIVKEGQITVQ
jgi:tripartite-type tricarboxylate transporter receptor subunit TctC